jgi:hypothetical protein
MGVPVLRARFVPPSRGGGLPGVCRARRGGVPDPLATCCRAILGHLARPAIVRAKCGQQHVLIHRGEGLRFGCKKCVFMGCFLSVGWPDGPRRAGCCWTFGPRVAFGSTLGNKQPEQPKTNRRPARDGRATQRQAVTVSVFGLQLVVQIGDDFLQVGEAGVGPKVFEN